MHKYYNLQVHKMHALFVQNDGKSTKLKKGSTFVSTNKAKHTLL